jgi:hypothetical protein
VGLGNYSGSWGSVVGTAKPNSTYRAGPPPPTPHPPPPSVPLIVEPFGVFSSLPPTLPFQERQRKYLSLSPWDKATLSMVSPHPCAYLGQA